MTQTLILRNGHLADLGKDILYHLGLPREDVNMSAIFGDVKFVCTGGSPRRFEMYAKEFAKDTGLKCSENMSQSDRFVMYKTGPVLWINVSCSTISRKLLWSFSFCGLY
ncbi:hypothetical protein AB6A40_004599 [Gnathostoma spinigerum]|uniref:Uncharacterized protein n=1 Tax=Gnathostoma spinigerum TaxID=75299 RepID=A0ABD6EE37_9BILA